MLTTVYDLRGNVPGRFDYVILSNVLSHLRDPVRALEAIASVLAPGGTAVLAASVVLDSATRPAALFAGDPTRILWWVPTPEGLRGWCSMAGFNDIRDVDSFCLESLRGTPSTALLHVVHAREPAP